MDGMNTPTFSTQNMFPLAIDYNARICNNIAFAKSNISVKIKLSFQFMALGEV